jgi:hypothetical protein
LPEGQLWREAPGVDKMEQLLDTIGMPHPVKYSFA